MNLKAVYYALSRMLLPTISVVVISLMYSLSPSKTFGFLLSDNISSGILRIVLMLAEMAWFYYLYTEFVKEESIKNQVDSQDYQRINYYDLTNKLEKLGKLAKGKDFSTSDSNIYNYNYDTKNKVLVVKM